MPKLKDPNVWFQNALKVTEEMATRRVNGFHASCPIIRGIRRQPSELSATGPRRVVHSD